MKSVSGLLGLEVIDIVLPIRMSTLLYRLIDSCIWINGYCVGDEMAKLSLYDRDRRVRPEKNGNVWAICFERLRRTDNGRENCYWLFISQNQSTQHNSLHTDVCQIIKAVAVIVAKRCSWREIWRPMRAASSSSVGSPSRESSSPELDFLRGLLLAA